MKITFVHFGRENLGIEYLSAILKKDGHRVDLVCDPGLFSKEDNVFYSPFLERLFRKKDIVGEIARSKPDMVAFSVYTTTYRWACEIAKAVKEHMSVPIVFGGIHSTLVPERVISNSFVDYVSIGESDYTFPELIRSLQDGNGVESVNNIYYKRHGRIMRNPLREPIQNLDALPFPDKELFADLVNYKDDYMILTSRGCPNSCSYCCESYLNRIYRNRYFRRRSVNSVIEELVVMKKKYNMREVMFFDSIFFTDKIWLRELLAYYEHKISLPFACDGHVRYFDYEIGKLLKDSGCYLIDFGVQTFNQKIRRNILNRPEDNAQIRKIFSICDDLKLRYDIDLILGLPGISDKDYKLPLEFLKENRYLNRIRYYFLGYFPKLGIVEKAKELGVLQDKDIQDIENGCLAHIFHTGFIIDAISRSRRRSFQKLYKLYPIIPHFLKSIIINCDFYNHFALIPNFLIICIQYVNSIINKDRRFRVYTNNYLLHFRKFFFEA